MIIKKQFSPLTITLETEKELNLLTEILCNFIHEEQLRDRCKIVGGERYYTNAYYLADQLRKGLHV